ncbi:hypothetical protein [Chitinophaga sancti]|uniref:hypothetical protein n=1 Tax=Chitinophaga sancti TaxID=1004 RepID=UPI003F790FB0
MKKIILCCLFSFAFLSGYPQQIEPLMDTAHVTGLSVGIITNNQVAGIKAYGYSSNGQGPFF